VEIHGLSSNDPLFFKNKKFLSFKKMNTNMDVHNDVTHHKHENLNFQFLIDTKFDKSLDLSIESNAYFISSNLNRFYCFCVAHNMKNFRIVILYACRIQYLPGPKRIILEPDASRMSSSYIGFQELYRVFAK
jgi:hypothetical protein